MTLREAWEILEINPDEIMQILSGFPDIKSRAEATEEILKRAKKITKRLLARNHPDINPNNPSITEKFKQIQMALSTIESHTKRFQNRVKELTTREITKNDVFIVINK